MKKTMACIGLLALTLGCTDQSYYWSRSGTDRNTFEMDRAKCQMYAQNYVDNRSNNFNSGTMEVSSSGYYDPDIGYFSGSSTITQEENPFKPFFDAIAEEDAFELCMKSKGYKMSQKRQNSSRKYSAKMHEERQSPTDFLRTSSNTQTSTSSQPPIPCQNDNFCPDRWSCRNGLCEKD